MADAGFINLKSFGDTVVAFSFSFLAVGSATISFSESVSPPLF